MRTPAATQIVAALAAEHAALLKFAALLEREQAMLVENRTNQLLELSGQKTTDALNLDRLAETRRALLKENISQPGIAPSGITKAAHPPPDYPGAAPARSTPPDARPAGGLGADAIRVWLETHSQEGLDIWQKIRGLAVRAQQLNHTNGELIQMKLRHNQQTLAVLSNAADKANLYGPDGQHSFSTGSGRSLGSG